MCRLVVVAVVAALLALGIAVDAAIASLPGYLLIVPISVGSASCICVGGSVTVTIVTIVVAVTVVVAVVITVVAIEQLGFLVR